MIFLALILIAPAAGAGSENPGLQPARIILNPTTDPAHEQAVTWRTGTRLESPMVEVAPARQGVDLEDYSRKIKARAEQVQISDSTSVWHYSAVIRKLKPGTLYYYRVGAEENWSEWISFRTTQISFEPFSFVFMGDPQLGFRTYVPRIFRQALLTSPEARFWLFGGDQVNVGDSDQEFGDFFGAGSWMFRSINILPVAGNHEYPRSNDLLMTKKLTPLWKPHYTLPENGPDGLEETCYWIDYQGVRIIILNGNEKLVEQGAWLEKILKKNSSAWTIVGIHQPVYSTGSDRDNPELQELFLPLFDRFAVDLVLQGHDHTYGRTYPLRAGEIATAGDKGTVYVVSSSGAKFYEQNPRYLDLMAETTLDTQLFQVIDLKKNALHYQAVTATGEVIDSFTLRK